MKKYISIGSNELDTYLDYALFSAVSIFMLNASPKEIGILGACYALPFFFLSSVFGKYSDSLDVRKFRALLFLLCMLITPAILIADSMVTVYLVLLAKISCRCGLNVSMPKLNSKDDESQRFYEISGYLVNISRVIIPLLSIYLYKEHGLLSVVLLSSALNFLGLIITLLDKPDGTTNKKDNHIPTLPPINIIYNNKELFILVSAYIMSSISFYLSNDMLSLFFQKIGQSVDSIGYIITILGIGGILGTKISTAMLSKFTPSQVYSGSLLFNSISFYSFGLTNSDDLSVLFYYLLILLTGLSSGVSFVALKLGIRKLVDFSYLSTVTGAIQKLSSIVAVILPLLGGVTADYFGIQTTFTITGMMLSIVLVYTIIRSQPQKVQRTFI